MGLEKRIFRKSNIGRCFVKINDKSLSAAFNVTASDLIGYGLRKADVFIDKENKEIQIIPCASGDYELSVFV